MALALLLPVFETVSGAARSEEADARRVRQRIDNERIGEA
jgi:hypothetical protein